jgi:hypothetical protein
MNKHTSRLITVKAVTLGCKMSSVNPRDIASVASSRPNRVAHPPLPVSSASSASRSDEYKDIDATASAVAADDSRAMPSVIVGGQPSSMNARGIDAVASSRPNNVTHPSLPASSASRTNGSRHIGDAASSIVADVSRALRDTFQTAEWGSAEPGDSGAVASSRPNEVTHCTRRVSSASNAAAAESNGYGASSRIKDTSHQQPSAAYASPALRPDGFHVIGTVTSSRIAAVARTVRASSASEPCSDSLGHLYKHPRRPALMELLNEIYGNEAGDRVLSLINDTARGIASDAADLEARRHFSSAALDILRRAFDANPKPDNNAIGQVFARVCAVDPEHATLTSCQQYFRRKRYVQKRKSAYDDARAHKRQAGPARAAAAPAPMESSAH